MHPNVSCTTESIHHACLCLGIEAAGVAVALARESLQENLI